MKKLLLISMFFTFAITAIHPTTTDLTEETVIQEDELITEIQDKENRYAKFIFIPTDTPPAFTHQLKALYRFGTGKLFLQRKLSDINKFIKTIEQEESTTAMITLPNYGRIIVIETSYEVSSDDESSESIPTIKIFAHTDFFTEGTLDESTSQAEIIKLIDNLIKDTKFPLIPRLKNVLYVLGAAMSAVAFFKLLDYLTIGPTDQPPHPLIP